MGVPSFSPDKWLKPSWMLSNELAWEPINLLAPQLAYMYTYNSYTDLRKCASERPRDCKKATSGLECGYWRKRGGKWRDFRNTSFSNVYTHSFLQQELEVEPHKLFVLIVSGTWFNMKSQYRTLPGQRGEFFLIFLKKVFPIHTSSPPHVSFWTSMSSR